MKKYKHKKSVILLVIAAASLGISSLALADPATGAATVAAIKAETFTISKAIKDLADKMVGLGFAGMTAFNQSMYQFDSNLATILVSNASTSIVDQDASSIAATQTNHYIQGIMSNIPNAFLSTSNNARNSSKIRAQIKTHNAIVNNLTLGVPASDTLYINNPTSLAAGYGSLSPDISHYYQTTIPYTIGSPPINDDDYFSVSSILGPSAYSKSDLNAANGYIAYLTKTYDDPTSGLKLSALKSYINSLEPSKQSQALYNFVSSPKYQDYQLALRSYMATKSIAINNFEQLVAERTPSKTAVSGIYNNKGQPIKNPSILQVKSYQANNRINNSAWLQSLQTMSSASLQREIAIELAQIIQQNYQAHLDSERLLATMSAMQLQATQGSKLALKTMAQQVNQQISGYSETNTNNNKGAVSPEQAQKNAEADAKKQQEEAQQQAQKAAQRAQQHGRNQQ